MKYLVTIANIGQDLINKEIIQLWKPYNKKIIGDIVFFSVGDKDGKTLRLSMLLRDFKECFNV